MLGYLTLVLVAVGLTLSGGLTVVSANPELVRAKQLEDEARVHLRQRQYPEGIGKARSALALREQVVDGMHPDLVPTLRLLGDLLFQGGGAWREARPVLERLVAIHDRAYGPDDVRVLPHLMTLGAVVRINGDLLGARSVLERAVAVAQRAHGPESPTVGSALGALGFVLTHTGKHAEAREVLERALRIEDRSFGPDSPQALKTAEYLALALEASGEYAAARPLLERAVRSWERRTPGGPGLADRLSALAQIVLAMGDRLRARELAERAAAMTEARGGSPSARAQGVLADVLESEGKLVEARPLRERVVAIQEKSYGSNFPWVAEANNDFADILVATGDHATARSHYERALAIGRRLSAPEQVWRATLGLGRIHERDGLLAEAVGHYRTAVTTVEGLAAQFGRQESRRQYLEANQRLAVYDALARALLRLNEVEPRKGYDREAAGVLDAKRARIAAEALTAVRPTSPDPQVRAAIDQIRAREDQALALEGATQRSARRCPARGSSRLRRPSARRALGRSSPRSGA